MAFDGIVTKCIVSELNTCILNGKINKVFQPTKNDVILGIYANGKNYALHICISAVNYRINLTTSSKPNPLNAPNFCMLLRKYLIGTKIKKISTCDLERIVTIELEGFNELNDLISKRLVIELMGKHSNVILLNENNIIIDSLRHLDTFGNSTRDILPARKYVYPDCNKLKFTSLSSFDEFYNVIYNDLDNQTLDIIIPNKFNGISKIFIKSIISELQLVDFRKENIEKIYDYINNILHNANFATCIDFIDSERNKSDYVVTFNKNALPLNINFFIDEYYSKKESSEEFKTYRNNILKLILNELKKYSKRLSNINQKLEECSNMDICKLYGELITANLYRLSNTNMDKLTVENYYDNNKLIDIPLDKSISPSNNAKKYYKKYNKLKSALEIVTKQKANTSKEIDYLESIIYELENAKNIVDVNDVYVEISENVLFKDKLKTSNNSKKVKSSKKHTTSQNIDPLHFVIDDFDVFVGKNNKNNDYLTLKLANHNDIWFHTKNIHGSHVILKTNGKEVDVTTINKCASLAAFHSKASSSSNVPVDYTYVKYVKKPNGAKPGMVIYTNYTTVNVNPIVVTQSN